MNHIHQWPRCLALACALLLAGIGGAQAANYEARLSARPTNYLGQCPVKITFKGTIRARRAGRVQYKFIRSDGAFAPIHTLEFRAPGVHTVSTTWTLGGAKLPRYSGWEAIQIVYPTSLTSNKAHFRIACQGSAKSTLHLNPAMRAPMHITTRKPDLVVRYFGLKQWGACRPHNVLMTFQVTVVNRGTAPSPKISSYAMVQVRDQHHINWGNGAFLNAIPPGGSQTVQVPVYYLMSNTAHMTSAAPHPFRAVVDAGNRVKESNEANNASRVIMVDPRKLCKR